MARTVEVVVGIVGRPHGIRGELGIAVRTDEPDRRFAAGSVLHAEGEPHRTWRVVGMRWHQQRLLIRLDGIADRTQAEALRGTRLAVTVPHQQRPDDAAEYYDHQLVGLTVRDHLGRAAGTVSEVLHLPGQDVLEVEVPGHTEPRLVPLVTALVPEIEPADGWLQLADVPGLLTEMDDEGEGKPRAKGGDD